MATSLEFIEFICEQITGSGEIRYRKMFGEYMVYVNNRPLLLICDNTVYVKKLAALKDIMEDSETAIPYKGAKEHYILDIDDFELSRKVIAILEAITSIPVKRKKKEKIPSGKGR
ncbi:MAG: transcriptional regulator [Tissierellia bacterium]|nr:transcriptional regulator [Tissierellia bacterium]